MVLTAGGSQLNLVVNTTVLVKQAVPASRKKIVTAFSISDSTVSETDTASVAIFHNTGLYNQPCRRIVLSSGWRRVYEFFKRVDDVGRFKAPTLRNVAITAPYMHDGSAATLSEVLDHYAGGGRTITTTKRCTSG